MRERLLQHREGDEKLERDGHFHLIADYDIQPIAGAKSFFSEFLVESKKLWFLAAPAIFTSVCQYSLGAITQLFAGHVDNLTLAAVSVENSVIAGFSFGVMLGMGSALETLCGQAYGAGQLDMLGIYMQRSWVILNSTALLLTLFYIFAGPILRAIGQAEAIAEAAGILSIWMIPQLFAYSMNFPIAKFLQAQGKMMAMAAISVVALLLHSLFSWLLMIKLRWGLAGAAVVLNGSWWFIVVAQLVYIFGGACGRAWNGFSWKAFHNLWGFVRLSLASAVMLWEGDEKLERDGHFHLIADYDIQPIAGAKSFFSEFLVESKKLWFLAAPAIFTSVCQYSLGAITQLFAGHVDNLTLAAVSVENSVIAGFSFGVMLGMGSALETLCGQAYGAGQLDMLGIYMQRSWVILNSTALLLTLFYIFAGPILRAIGQAEAIAEAAGILSIWMIPQLFAYSMNFPIAKFLQAQGKMMAMAAISVVALLLHSLFSWLLMIKLRWGLAGAAVVLNGSWWFIVVAQLVYIFGGACGRAWNGFSWKAFHNLWGFVRLSLASAVMLCLEVWYFFALVLFAGYLPNPEVSVDALSICMNLLGWALMVAMGANAATSVRISNELGAGHPRTAKFSVVVVVITAFLMGLCMSLILIILRKPYPSVFTNSAEVRKLVYHLTPLLAFSITLNNVQPVLSGVAIGAGWQAAVAYVNIASYYIFGIPLGLILGYKLHMGVEGIWFGMIGGTSLQTLILIWMTCKTNWNKEASVAEDRIRKWGGHARDYQVKGCST